jgi:GNAT superfamily N-acetyltransferase
VTVAIPPRSAPFPQERPDRPQIPAPLAGRGYSLRALRAGDLPWLRELYASTRAEEMAAVPWSEIAKRGFLDQQFALQHQHYLTHFGDSDFLAIEYDGRPVGRYYLQRVAPDHLIVDISLFPEQRGQGVGAALIRHSQAEAAALERGMRLHVHDSNPGARRLYERLGFIAVGTAEQGYRPMRWAPAASRPAAPSAPTEPLS